MEGSMHMSVLYCIPLQLPAQPKFTVGLLEIGTGFGRTIVEAKENAARNALETIWLGRHNLPHLTLQSPTR